MDEHLENVFLSEVVTKAEFTNESITHLNHHLNNENYDTSHIFYCLYAYLHNLSNITLCFWPSNWNTQPTTVRALRATRLRNLLDLQDEHILNQRKFRNHIAHMDERLDEWWTQSQTKSIARQIVGPRNLIGGLEVNEIFEHYVPNEKILIFRGDEYNIESSFQEVIQIQEKCQNILKERNR